MHAAGIQKAHVSGLSLGAATGMWLAAKYPEKVRSLSLHSGWPRTDPFIKAVIEGFQIAAKALESVPQMTIRAIFPWCFTPELYAAKPEYIQSLGDFVLSRPVQPVAAFMQQSDAVLTHNAEAQLARITAPTLITFGRYDMVTSTRFADGMNRGIRNSELLVFEGCAHAPIYEKVEEFNRKTCSSCNAIRERLPRRPQKQAARSGSGLHQLGEIPVVVEHRAVVHELEHLVHLVPVFAVHVVELDGDAGSGINAHYES